VFPNKNKIAKKLLQMLLFVSMTDKEYNIREYFSFFDLFLQPCPQTITEIDF
jgi:hypothetical protein